MTDNQPQATTDEAGRGPVNESERILSLDLIRGVAVLGVLLMNAVSFVGLDSQHPRRHSHPPTGIPVPPVIPAKAGIHAWPAGHNPPPTVTPAALRHSRAYTVILSVAKNPKPPLRSQSCP